MSQLTAEKEGLALEAVVSPLATRVRLAIGLLQGIFLYLLYSALKDHAWPATQPYLFAPLLLLGLIVPVLLISSLGHMPPRKAGLWALAAACIIAALAAYDIWRGGNGHDMLGRRAGDGFPAELFFFSTAGFYIAHSLVMAGAFDRRGIARYATYFEQAWKLAIQLLFSAFFVGALWLVLWLGATLFMLVKLAFLQDLLQKSWFAIPVSFFAFSCAMHLTDVRPAIVRGIRTLLLVLMSWILPVATLIVAGFLLSLPFNGIDALWATRSATSVLLGTAALLVILINAAFQNGEAGAGVARIIRISARVAALLLLPVSGIAVYALGLRVGDYGWTSDRITAAACLAVTTCYALGYAWAASRRGAWLQPIAPVNVATAFVVLGVLLALFSPLADPARLSVNDQVARLAAGKVGADKFDFNYLRLHGVRYGRAALEQLQSRNQGPDAARIREGAALALQQKVDRAPEKPERGDIGRNLKVWPATASLPASFLSFDWSKYSRAWELPRCMKELGRSCDAYMIDFDADSRPEVLLIAQDDRGASMLFTESKDGDWMGVGRLASDFTNCAPLRSKLQAGQFELVAPRMKDLEIAGQRIEVLSSLNVMTLHCPR